MLIDAVYASQAQPFHLKRLIERKPLTHDHHQTEVLHRTIEESG